MSRQRLETIDTLAERFGLPRRTIEREVLRGRLPYVSIAGSWRFRERDLELWLERAGALPRLQMLRGGRPDGLSATARSTEEAEGGIS